MMRSRTERDLAGLIRDSAVANGDFKDRLRQRLFDETAPLSLDDLDCVTGGAALPETEDWLPWDMPEDETKKNPQKI